MSQEIKLKIRKMGGEEVEIETPADILVDDLIEELCRSLHLTTTDDSGRPIKWKLDDIDAGRTLVGRESLEVEGVKGGHRLALIRSEVAGGALVGTLSSIDLTKVDENYQEKGKIKTANLLARFLWACSGASAKILNELPGEQSKYQAIGAAILTGGMLAALSGGYFLYLVSTNLLLSILFGIIWGVMEFSLARFIVTSINVQAREEVGRIPHVVARMLRALPRLMLSILIGITISKPLEIALFRDVINQRIYGGAQERKDQLTKEIAKAEATISALEYRLKAKDEEIVGLQNLYQSEIAGRQGSSRRPGAGPLLREIESRLSLALKEREQLSQTTQEAIYNEKIHLSELKVQELILNSDPKETASPLRELYELSQLTKENATIAKVQMLIMILILLITVAPIMTKLLSPRGPYDALLERLEYDLPEKESLEIQKAFNEALDRSSFNPHK